MPISMGRSKTTTRSTFESTLRSSSADIVGASFPGAPTETTTSLFIVRVFAGDTWDRMVFVGTGTVVTPSSVLTCHHVLAECDPFGRPTDRLWSRFCVEVQGGKRVRAHRSVVDAGWDLGLLHLEDTVVVGALPILCGINASAEVSLNILPLCAYGYSRADSDGLLWKHDLNDRLLLSSYRGNDEILSQLQWSGGIPAGCSGGPVLLSWRNGRICVGILYLGGEGSATSRAVVGDPICEFLEGCGLRLNRVNAQQILSLPASAGVADAVCPHPEQSNRFNPYKGLFAFKEGDSGHFFGRDAEIDALFSDVRLNPLTTVVGVSGSGKSSLVQAGLIPRLRSDAEWRAAFFRPQRDPYAALAAAIAPLVYPGLGGLQRRQKCNELIAEFSAGSLALTDALAAGIEESGAHRLLLVVDPFEELFTQKSDERLTNRFIEELCITVDADIACSVLIVVRADFLGRMLDFGSLAALVDRYPKKMLGLMSNEALRTAIERPAIQLGVRLEAGLADRLLHDVGRQPGILPLLQFTLTELWERRRDGLLTHGSYEAIGGASSALAYYAEGIVQRFPNQENQLRQIFLQLVQPGEGTQDTRRPATRAQIGETNWSLVIRLADRRLVVTGQDDEGTQTVELIHEALIQCWERLRRWVDQDRQFRMWQDRLRRALAEWQNRNHDPDLLLRSGQLAEALERLEVDGERLAPEECQYIQISDARLKEEHRAQRRTRHIAFGALMTAFLAVAGLLVWALIERDRAHLAYRDAEAGRLAALEAKHDAESQRTRVLAHRLAVQGRLEIAQRPTDLVQATLLAVESIRRHRTLDGYLAWAEAMRLLPRTPIRLPHEDEVTDITFRPRGGEVASAGWDGVVSLWDPLSGREIIRFRHDHPVDALAFSPDGRRVATAAEKTVRIWEVSSGTEFLRFSLDERVTAIVYHPSSRWVAAGTGAGVVWLWDAHSGKEVAHVPHNSSVSSIAFSPDGSRLAVASEDGLVRLWKPATQEPIIRLRHEDAVWSLSFSPSGDRLATAGSDHTVRVWNVLSAAELVRLEHPGAVWTAAFDGKGKRLVTASADGAARVWDAATGHQLMTVHHELEVLDAIFSPEGSLIATASADKTMRIWEAESGKELFRMPHNAAVRSAVFSRNGELLVSRSADSAAWIWQIDPHAVSTNFTQRDGIANAAFSPGTSLLALALASEPAIQVMDLDHGQEVARLHYNGAIDALAFGSHGTRLATASREGTAHVWDVATNREIARLDHGHPVMTVAFDPNGQRLATGSWDKSARLWNAETGEELRRLSHGGPVWIVSFSGDGARVATASLDKSVRIWNTASGEEIVRIPLKEVAWTFSLSPDGAYVATGTPWDPDVRIWDASTSKELARLPHEKGVWGVVFGPSRSQLATMGLDGNVRLWDVPAGRLKTRLPHDGAVTTAAFHPNGQYLATGSWDHTARVWDLDDGREIARFAHDSEIGALSFIESGAKLVTVSFANRNQLDAYLRWQGQPEAEADQILLPFSHNGGSDDSGRPAQRTKLWLWQTDDLVAAACSRLPRNLSRMEWKTFLHDDPYRATCPNLPVE